MSLATVVTGDWCRLVTLAGACRMPRSEHKTGGQQRQLAMYFIHSRVHAVLYCTCCGGNPVV